MRPFFWMGCSVANARRRREGECKKSFRFALYFFFSFFRRGKEKGGRFRLLLSLSPSLSPPFVDAMAANLASDPRAPPYLEPVSLPATAPRDSSVASTLLAATESLADAARALLPRLKPDPDNRRPPLSLTDAQSISQSRADERRRVQARKEKAGKASAKAFAISGVSGVGVGKGGEGGGGAAAAGSQQQLVLPHHPQGVGSEFPGAVPEGESEKSAYWTFVQVRLDRFFFFPSSIEQRGVVDLDLFSSLLPTFGPAKKIPKPHRTRARPTSASSPSRTSRTCSRWKE